MRGADHQQSGMFSYISAERRVPEDHPLRAIRAMVDVALRNMGAQFDAMYAKEGRPSIAPEKLLRDPSVPIGAESNQIEGMVGQSYPPEP